MRQLQAKYHWIINSKVSSNQDEGLWYAAGSSEVLDESYEDDDICIWPQFMINSLALTGTNADTNTNSYGTNHYAKHDGVISAWDIYIYAGENTATYADSHFDFEQEPTQGGETACDLVMYTVSKRSSGGTYTRYASIDDAFSTAPSSGDSLYIANNDSVTTDISIPSGVIVVVEAPMDGDMVDDDNYERKIIFTANTDISVSGRLVFDQTAYSDGSDILLSKVTGGNNWSGIDITNTGILDVNTDFTLEYAIRGIDIANSSGLLNGFNVTTIQNCSQAGVKEDYCSPVIDHIITDNVSTSTYQHGGIWVEDSVSDPNIQFVTIKGNSLATGTYYGIHIDDNADATVDYTDIQDSVYRNSIQIDSGGGICLESGGLGGYNNICRISSSYKAINNPSTGSISAQNNWWGTSSPSDGLFTYPALVTYSNHLTSTESSAGAEKGAVSPSEKTIFQLAQAEETVENYSEAISLYKEALQHTDDTYIKRRVLKALLRTMDKYNRNYSILQEIIKNELVTAENDYKALLIYIRNTIMFREGKYNEAVASFAHDSESYKGSVWEVQMLARAAKISGDYLDDKGLALEYAHRAAAVNPGAGIVQMAYEAAGESYNPAEYEDAYVDKVRENMPDTEQGSIMEDYVIAAPNPANPQTTISYYLNNPSHVRLRAYP